MIMGRNWPWKGAACESHSLLFLMRLYWPFLGVRALIYLQFSNSWFSRLFFSFFFFKLDQHNADFKNCVLYFHYF